MAKITTFRKFLIAINVLFLINTISAQEYTINFNVNINEDEIKDIASIWHDYLRSNSKEHWKKEEVKALENFNVQNMPSILNPPLLDWKLNNRILSISNISDNKYILKSAFFNNDLEIFAVTNVIVEKINNEFNLSNYIYEYTKDWDIKERAHIKYIYTATFKVKSAEKFYKNLCEVFNIEPELITYFIAEDCDDIYTMLGYDFFISKGMGTECGYFESKNNFVFATKKGGANHYHEITHFINTFYPKANDLLLTGLSAYISGNKAHFGKPLKYHIDRVGNYLKTNKEVDLSNPFDFYFMDKETNPQYVIGALLCDIIIEKKGREGLLRVFENYGTDEELLNYLNKEILNDNESLNDVLRERIHTFSTNKKFKNRLGF
ncbi:hypothetical protein SAMN02927937_01613 [Paenimyroides aquimaris]|uniref:Uncharacterized protein n=1 Tax=Paenimyroides marinum TaxID=1159016 RepID=A0A1H6L1J4_9FLAO|nr:hypothetical protein [Paenimyroides aquimaris]SEH82100.1 hypothetical protein SAMN02927937_01613 [Paenimyroides aquimaris]